MPKYRTNTSVLIKDPEGGEPERWFPPGTVIEISVKIAIPYLEGGWISPIEPPEGGEGGGEPVEPAPGPVPPPEPAPPGTPAPVPPAPGTPEPAPLPEPPPAPTPMGYKRGH